MICKAFKEEPIAREDLAMILWAGVNSPSPNNAQCREFILITDDKKTIAESCMNEEILKAPVIIAVCSNKDIIKRRFGEENTERFAAQDAASAVSAMISVAELLDIGHIWLGEFDDKRLKENLLIPDNFSIQCILALGYCANTAEKQEKLRVSEITFLEKYGNRITPLYDLYEWKGAKYYLNKLFRKKLNK
jgi:nitroreductase